jgi:hypothetical protein
VTANFKKMQLHLMRPNQGTFFSQELDGMRRCPAALQHPRYGNFYV